MTGEFSGEDGPLSLASVFGGGNTHSQIAAYHFSEHPEAIADLSDYITDEEARDAFVEISDELSVKTAVFEGGYVNAMNAKCNRNDESAPDTQTM